MKKIFLFLIFISFFLWGEYSFAACSYDESSTADITANINNCLSGTNLVTSGDLSVENTGWGFHQKINEVIQNIGQIILLLAVGSLVYAGYLMVFSAGEEESIKKGKDIIKWTIFGFLWVLFASTLIYLVVNFVYSIGS